MKFIIKKRIQQLQDNNITNTALEIKDEVAEIFLKFGLPTFTETSLAWSIKIDYDTVNIKNFHAKFWTVIDIPKGIEVFYMRHYFMLRNEDPNRIMPFLSDWGSAFIMKQYLLEAKWKNHMKPNKYEELTYNDIIEPIPQMRSKNGQVVRVGMILFGEDYDCLGMK